MQIYACGDYYDAAEPPRDLKAAVAAAVGEPVRRIGRFIQLALIGAGRCAQALRPPADTGVYLCSGRGDLETTIEVMTGLFRDGQPPKPLSFVNTVSNAACFYVARALQLQGRSNFVCNRYFAFESALQLALLDAEQGAVTSALVGSVDVVCTPLPDHRRRLELAPDAPVGEGSHWLWLGTKDVALPRRGELLAARHFDSMAALLEWLLQQAPSPHNCLLGTGQFLDDAALAVIQESIRLPVFDYRTGRAHYDSQSGAAIHEFLQRSPPGAELLHVNANPQGQFSVVYVRH